MNTYTKEDWEELRRHHLGSANQCDEAIENLEHFEYEARDEWLEVKALDLKYAAMCQSVIDGIDRLEKDNCDCCGEKKVNLNDCKGYALFCDDCLSGAMDM